MENRENMGRLIGIIYRHTRMYYNHELSKLGLGSGGHIFILMLNEKDGISQNEITERLHFDKAHTARTIVKFMELGYVTKKQDVSDRRAYRLYLTDKGRNIIPEIRKATQKWWEILLSGVNDNEKDKLFEMLLKISDTAIASVRCCPEIKNDRTFHMRSTSQ